MLFKEIIIVTDHCDQCIRNYGLKSVFSSELGRRSILDVVCATPNVVRFRSAVPFLAAWFVCCCAGELTSRCDGPGRGRVTGSLYLLYPLRLEPLHSAHSSSPHPTAQLMYENVCASRPFDSRFLRSHFL